MTVTDVTRARRSIGLTGRLRRVGLLTPVKSVVKAVCEAAVIIFFIYELLK